MFLFEFFIPSINKDGPTSLAKKGNLMIVWLSATQQYHKKGYLGRRDQMLYWAFKDTLEHETH